MKMDFFKHKTSENLDNNSENNLENNNLDKKEGHLTFDSENLAVPEIHTHEKIVDEKAKQEEEKLEKEEQKNFEKQQKENENKKSEIFFDNLAIPEIHLKNKKED